VLVMDDEEVVREVAGEMLNQIVYEAVMAENGDEAVELYKENLNNGSPFDVIIMDLTVPGFMGGRETIEKLLEIDPAVKSIVSSGYSNDPIMANYRKYGFMEVIKKPYTVKELSEVLHHVLVRPAENG
jgi:two-component system cell cycle sensor histidine kinase/response regulator CckA